MASLAPPGCCFACGKRLGKNPRLADTRDGQTVYVGSECYELIRVAGTNGYQPPAGGPRLYLIVELEAAAICDGCNVRPPWEHRCHGQPCPCNDCREADETMEQFRRTGGYVGAER